MLRAAGWHVVDPGDVNLSAFRGTAIRNFSLMPGHRFADYLLCVDGKPAGAPARRGPW
jgi:type I restriction enzyme, R subunit